MDGLFLDMDRTPTPGEPCLRVSNEAGELRFTFLHSAPREADWWTAVYPIEQAEAALVRFVTRVGWFPKGHPLLAGVPLK
ncbi:MAG: hypothetical protein JWR84_2575 [Caulobacter sp.]|nr:hypothetical protein [Caulobacter sp.]